MGSSAGWVPNTRHDPATHERARPAHSARRGDSGSRVALRKSLQLMGVGGVVGWLYHDRSVSVGWRLLVVTRSKEGLEAWSCQVTPVKVVPTLV